MVLTEEDMKNHEFFEILQQSFKTVFSNKKIFTKITLTLLLPLILIFVVQPVISHRAFPKIESKPFDWEFGKESVAGVVYFVLFKFIYYTLSALFFLLSTAAISLTVASIYTNRDVTFLHVLKIVPKIWKRLFVTFLYFYVAFFLYIALSVGILLGSYTIFGFSSVGVMLFFVWVVLYMFGFFYFIVVWQLASVVTVLENIKGFKAMSKGKTLLYGKKMAGMVIAFAMYVVLALLINALAWFVQYGDEASKLHMIWRVMIGILCGLLLMIWLLMFIAVHNILYLVCKSFHGEAIDKLSLSTILEGYTFETMVLPNSS